MGTVSNALSLLKLFNHARSEIGLSDMTRLSGMNKATVYRLLGELQDRGFVEQSDANRSYRLGPEVLRLAALREAAVPLLSVSREILERLCQTTGETAHMSMIQGTQLNTLSYAYGTRHATRVMMEDAEVLSFHATSSGRAILAFALPTFVDVILAGQLTPHTNATQTDPDRIRAIFTSVRETGIAETDGEFEIDVHTHAAPVFGADQQPIGALAVAAPASRMTAQLQSTIRDEVRTCAQALTLRTGGFHPAHYPLKEPS